MHVVQRRSNATTTVQWKLIMLHCCRPHLAGPQHQQTEIGLEPGRHHKNVNESRWQKRNIFSVPLNSDTSCRACSATSCEACRTFHQSPLQLALCGRPNWVDPFAPHHHGCRNLRQSTFEFPIKHQPCPFCHCFKIKPPIVHKLDPSPLILLHGSSSIEL